MTAHSTQVALPLRARLYEADQQPAFVYFPVAGVASVVIEMPNGETAEVGFIGHEGAVGSAQLLGPGRVTTSCFVQIEMIALRVPFERVRTLTATIEEIRTLILESVQAHMMSISQVAGCNRLHEAEERLSRWLLMATDRTGSQTLHFTQEFLAEMLGVQRPTLNIIVGQLERRGLIESSRGRVTIVNYPALVNAACDCYPIIRDIHKKLYWKSTAVAEP